MTAAPITITSSAIVSRRVQAARSRGAGWSMMPLLLLDLTRDAAHAAGNRVAMLATRRAGNAAQPGGRTAPSRQSCGLDSIEICSLPAISSWQDRVFMSAGSRNQTRWRQ